MQKTVTSRKHGLVLSGTTTPGQNGPGSDGTHTHIYKNTHTHIYIYIYIYRIKHPTAFAQWTGVVEYTVLPSLYRFLHLNCVFMLN